MWRFLLVVLAIASAARSASATECPTTRQFAFDKIEERLDIAAADPARVSAAERYCLVGIAGQIAGLYPPALETLANTETPAVVSTLQTLAPELPPAQAIRSGATFAKLRTAIAQSCTPEILRIAAKDLTPEQGAACGLIAIPGAPRGLGKLTARYESSRLDGGYDAISADPGGGGWTYGRYQIASEAGLSDFLNALTCTGNHGTCLPEGYRPIGQKLIEAGGVQAAQRHTEAFVSAWQTLALNDRRMQQAQEIYQAISVWVPIRRYFAESLGIDLETASCGLRELALSVRTQHKLATFKTIFTEATRAAGTTDDAAIVKAANDYRLSRLGNTAGYYLGYGTTCAGHQPPYGDDAVGYACKYIKGVRDRWESEQRTYAPLTAKDCPPF